MFSNLKIQSVLVSQRCYDLLQNCNVHRHNKLPPLWIWRLWFRCPMNVGICRQIFHVDCGNEVFEAWPGEFRRNAVKSSCSLSSIAMFFTITAPKGFSSGTDKPLSD